MKRESTIQRDRIKSIIRYLDNFCWEVGLFLPSSEGELKKQLLDVIKPRLDALNKALTDFDNSQFETQDEIDENLWEITSAIESTFKEYENDENLKDVIQDIKGILHKNMDPIPSTIRVGNVTWDAIDRICFRGDKRNPSDVFETGFEPKNKSQNAVILDDAHDSKEGGIACSSRFLGAASFPYDTNVTKTWVYIFKIDKGIDRNKNAYILEQNRSPQFLEQTYVQEIITDHVPPDKIIGAVEIERYSRADVSSREDPTGFYKKLGSYKILSHRFNPNTSVTKEEKLLVERFIENEIAANAKSTKLPTTSSGYDKNKLFSTQKTMSAREKIQDRSKKRPK